MKKLIIDTEILQIRNLKSSDLLDFHFYRSNPEVTRYQGFDVFTINQSDEFITANNVYEIVAALRKGDAS